MLVNQAWRNVRRDAYEMVQKEKSLILGNIRQICIESNVSS